MQNWRIIYITRKKKWFTDIEALPKNVWKTQHCDYCDYCDWWWVILLSECSRVGWWLEVGLGGISGLNSHRFGLFFSRTLLHSHNIRLHINALFFFVSIPWGGNSNVPASFSRPPASPSWCRPRRHRRRRLAPPLPGCTGSARPRPPSPAGWAPASRAARCARWGDLPAGTAREGTRTHLSPPPTARCGQSGRRSSV